LALTPATRLGPYEIVSKLGEGGMGEVYRATDSNLKRSVAIKVLPAAVASDADRLARFQREAEVLAALNHPNIAAIYGLERTPDVTALVMELVEGDDLSAHIARGAMPLAEALPIAKQIADALEAAHEQGIIHRDLKPANIKVRADGTVKVLDFGLAKALDSNVSSTTADAMNSPTLTARATQMGMIIGTAAYMAPEQARGRAVDRRADIWAFGVVVYEMFSGRRAFEGDDISITLASVLKEDVRWDALPSDLPPSIRRLLRRCLEKDPKRRLRSIGDARIELDDAGLGASGEGITAPVIVSTAPWWRRAIPVALATLGAAAIGVLAWTLKPVPTAKNVVSRFEYPLPEGQTFKNSYQHLIAISPDGTKIAYVANQELYLRAMDQLDAQPILGTHEDPSEPVFSPDGQQIAYFAPSATTLGEGALRKVAVSGSAPPTTLCKTASPPNGASWSNGLIVFGQYSGTMSSIDAVADSGGTPRVLVTIDPADGRPEQPQLIDGGARVLFTLLPTGVAVGDDGQIVVQGLNGGARTVVVTGGMSAQLLSNGQLLYIHGGTIFVVPFDARRSTVTGGPAPVVEGVSEETGGGTGKGDFAVSLEGTLVFRPGATNAEAPKSLVWVDRQGREQPIAAQPKHYSYPRLSPDGTKLAVGQRDESLDIWIWDFAKEVLSKLTSGPDNKQYPVWMPDSRRVIYRSIATASTKTSILRKAIDGTGSAETLLDEENGGQPNSIAPDGRLLVYRTASQPYDLRVLPLDPSGPSRPLVADPKLSETNGEVSPDGRWIAYESNETGPNEVFVRPFPDVDRGRWQLSSGGGHSPLWARSGRELYFESKSPSRLMAISIPPVPPNAAFAYGKPQPLFDFTPYRAQGVGRMYDQGLDGRFVTIREATGSAPALRRDALVIVSHWFDELKASVK
jgi:serine/threonine-protein kinase